MLIPYFPSRSYEEKVNVNKPRTPHQPGRQCGLSRLLSTYVGINSEFLSRGTFETLFPTERFVLQL